MDKYHYVTWLNDVHREQIVLLDGVSPAIWHFAMGVTAPEQPRITSITEISYDDWMTLLYLEPNLYRLDREQFVTMLDASADGITENTDTVLEMGIYEKQDKYIEEQYQCRTEIRAIAKKLRSMWGIPEPVIIKDEEIPF